MKPSKKEIVVSSTSILLIAVGILTGLQATKVFPDHRFLLILLSILLVWGGVLTMVYYARGDSSKHK